MRMDHVLSLIPSDLTTGNHLSSLNLKGPVINYEGTKQVGGGSQILPLQKKDGGGGGGTRILILVC